MAGTAEIARATNSEPTIDMLQRRSDNLRKLIWGAIKTRLARVKCVNRVKFGNKPMCRGRVLFWIRGTATFGNMLHINALSGPVTCKVERHATLTVGDYVGFNYGTVIEVWHEVRLGSYVKLGPRTSIIDDNRHEAEPGAARFKGPVIIEDGAWLTRNVTVSPGVRIGGNSVIGANSVVTKDIPPGVFAVGAPAKPVRKLALPDGWRRA